MVKDPYLTKQTLIQRAKNPDDQQAWEEFTAYYTSFIYMVLKRISYNHQDHDDLAQEILLKLWSKLKKYEPQKYKFRTWLSTVIRNTFLNFIDKKSRQQKREEKAFSDTQNDDIESSSQLMQIIQEEWEIFTINLAMERIRPHFSESALTVFEMILENTPTKEIAEKTSMSENNICKIKSRIKERLQREVRLINHEA
ncbi:MAG: sigma-70 family RNA polymerase sigma factor [Lentisphaerales bacterium]|nr:sigma-70 family RNA polymerase sigma factor [Lentisphaerales bacterium]